MPWSAQSCLPSACNCTPPWLQLDVSAVDWIEICSHFSLFALFMAGTFQHHWNLWNLYDKYVCMLKPFLWLVRRPESIGVCNLEVKVEKFRSVGHFFFSKKGIREFTSSINNWSYKKKNDTYFIFVWRRRICHSFVKKELENFLIFLFTVFFETLQHRF